MVWPRCTEWHIYRCHRERLQDRLLRFSGAQQSDRPADAANDVSVDDELLAGGVGAGAIRLQSSGHAMSEQRGVLSLQVSVFGIW